MKTIATLLLITLSTLSYSQEAKTVPVKDPAAAQAKLDSVTFIPNAGQFKIIQDLDTQINELKRRQIEFIAFGFGEAIDPNTIRFDGKKFVANKAKE